MANWGWTNEPPTWTDGEGRVALTTAPGTDFWRETHYGFVRDSGHLYAVERTGDFVAEATVRGAYRDQYDQAGLMVRLDERTWLKCGIEYVDGRQQASAVLTRGVSDWSVASLPDGLASLRLRVTRQGPAIEVRYGVDGGGADGDAAPHLLRLGYLAPDPTVLVGAMAASPDGAGFEVAFEGLTVRDPADGEGIRG